MNYTELILETLEDRFLLSGSVTVDGSDLLVAGTGGADFVEVRQVGSQLRVIVNDFDHGTYSFPTGHIHIETFGGDDEIRFQVGVTLSLIHI